MLSGSGCFGGGSDFGAAATGGSEAALGGGSEAAFGSGCLNSARQPPPRPASCSSEGYFGKYSLVTRSP